MTEPNRRPCVVLLTAMRQELKPVVSLLRLRRLSRDDRGVDDRGVFAGSIGEAKVVATLTTMGMAAATETTEGMLEGVVVDHVVVVGIAGGVHPGRPLGHVLVPEFVVDRYTGAAYRATPLTGLVPSGGLSTSDELDNTTADVERFMAEGIEAVDMETASIAAVCERHGVPWTAFRAISDRVGDELVDQALFGMANADGSPNPANIARYVATHPDQLANLARLGRQMDMAANAAAGAAIAACRQHHFERRRSEAG